MKGGNEKKIIIGYSVLHLGPSPLSFRSDINRCCQDHSSTRRWGQRHPQLQGERHIVDAVNVEREKKTFSVRV